jgi:hypothetical protein
LKIEEIMNKIIIWEERLKLSFYQDQKDIAITKINSLQVLLRNEFDLSILNENERIYYEEILSIYDENNSIVYEYIAFIDTLKYYNHLQL